MGSRYVGKYFFPLNDAFIFSKWQFGRNTRKMSIQKRNDEEYNN